MIQFDIFFKRVETTNHVEPPGIWETKIIEIKVQPTTPGDVYFFAHVYSFDIFRKQEKHVIRKFVHIWSTLEMG